MTRKELLKMKQRLEQISSSLVKEGWSLIGSIEETRNPYFGYTALRTFRHPRGGKLAISIEQTRIEIWRNGRLRHCETIYLE